MSASMLARWTVGLVACVAVASISSCTTWLWMATHSQPTVPLTAGLLGEWGAISTKFDSRIKAIFPVGSSEAEMGAKLQKQGFNRQDWQSSVEQEHTAMRREDRFPCNQAAYVYWHADAEGRLTSIKGAYREEGCL